MLAALAASETSWRITTFARSAHWLGCRVFSLGESCWVLKWFSSLGIFRSLLLPYPSSLCSESFWASPIDWLIFFKTDVGAPPRPDVINPNHSVWTSDSTELLDRNKTTASRFGDCYSFRAPRHCAVFCSWLSSLLEDLYYYGMIPVTRRSMIGPQIMIISAVCTVQKPVCWVAVANNTQINTSKLTGAIATTQSLL